MSYAENTSVSVDRSKAEIEKTLSRYGADQFIHGWDHKAAFIAFRAFNRMVKFVLPLPDKNDNEFKTTPSGRKKRKPEQIEKAYEQACRQKWRALALVIKAKLEAVETGITDFEDEFLSYIMLPDGSTVGKFMKPQIKAAYESKKMPKLLTILD